MATEPTVRLVLELPESLFAEIIEHRFTRRLPSRLEAIRRLLRMGLDAYRTSHTAPAESSDA